MKTLCSYIFLDNGILTSKNVHKITDEEYDNLVNSKNAWCKNIYDDDFDLIYGENIESIVSFESKRLKKQKNDLKKQIIKLNKRISTVDNLFTKIKKNEEIKWEVF